MGAGCCPVEVGFVGEVRGILKISDCNVDNSSDVGIFCIEDIFSFTLSRLSIESFNTKDSQHHLKMS